MKKNFFKLLLLGAFTLSLGAGFVGCKDYDDDIKDLQGQIDALKSGSAVKSVSYNSSTGELTVVGGDNPGTFSIKPNLPTYTLATSVSGNKVTVTLNGGATPSSVEITLPEVGGGDTYEEFDPTKLTADANGKILYNGVATGVTLPKFEQEGAIIEITTETNEDGEVIGYIISDGEVEIPIMLGIADALPLKSLVFERQTYLSGIEAMEAPSLEYYKWTNEIAIPATNTATNAQTGEVWWPIKAGTTLTRVNLLVVAEYHLNPASTTAAQIEDVAVLSDDIRFIGTRTAASAPSVEAWEVKNGRLVVKFKFENYKIEEVDADSVTSLAIQAKVKYEGKETTVTSDYAAAYEAVKTDFVLALKDKYEVEDDLRQRHLYGADGYTGGDGTDLDPTVKNVPHPTYLLAGFAQVAIDNAADYTLVYNDANGLDLKNKIAIHYIENLRYNVKTLEPEDGEFGISPADALAKYGLALKFSKSNYFQGGNDTPQDSFFDLTDGVVKAKVFGVNGMAAVGREPLVRVDLIDTNTGNQVVNAGWIKIRIVSPGIQKSKDFGNLYVQCEDLGGPSWVLTPYANAANTSDNRVEWQNVEIYNPLDMSYQDFIKLYEFEFGGSPKDANWTTQDAGYKFGDLGTVVEAQDAGESRFTGLLQWTLTPADQQLALAKTGADKGKASITVAYVAEGRDTVFVTLTTTIIEAQAAMSGKIAEYWNDAKTSIFVNTEVPGTQSDVADFYTDIDNTFVGNKPAFTGLTAAAAQSAATYGAANLEYFYQFDAAEVTELNKVPQKGNDNVTYTLAVDNDFGEGYSLLLARDAQKTQLVAVIDTMTGYIEYWNGETLYDLDAEAGAAWDPVVDGALTVPAGWPAFNAGNEIAEALLNRDAAGGANMFKAPIETKLGKCRNIPVTDNKFWATFYRPVNAEKAPAEKFDDHGNDGSTLNLVDLVLMTDWRDNVPSARNPWVNGANFGTILLENNSQFDTYWEYYAVDSLVVDIANVTTNLNGGDIATQKLSAVTNQMSLTNTQPTYPVDYSNIATQIGYIIDNDPATVADNSYYGTVTYTNNGADITRAFKLRLPVNIYYKWGVYTVTIDVDVVP